ncbi:MAG: hypothetical protein KKE11_03215 [Gammaproteobacteria bacterium]|nr:hypothetical protein [Gammaproteobacteria bacterium]
MKIKHIFLLASVFSLFIGLFNESAIAFALKCDETVYCNYEGMYQDIDNADEEFMMLMEPLRPSNFQDIFSVLLYIVGCSKQNTACMNALKNPSCKVFSYTQRLVNFYEDNMTDVNDEEVRILFKILRDGEGEIFFNTKPISNEGVL